MKRLYDYIEKALSLLSFFDGFYSVDPTRIVSKLRTILQSCMFEVESGDNQVGPRLSSAIEAIFSSKWYQRGLNDCIFSLVSLQFHSLLKTPALW